VSALSSLELPALSRIRIRLGVLVGVLFLAGPLSDLLQRSLSPAHEAALLLGLALFVAVYLALMPPIRWFERHGQATLLGALGLLPAIAIALLLAGAPASFAALFVYFVAAAGVLLPARPAVATIAVTTIGVGVAATVHGYDSAAVASTVLTIVGVGILMAGFGRVTRVNRELRAAREELARLAISEERLRIASDVHDLLGHSLSVIALKSELAAKLVEREPDRAAAELEDIQMVSRQALAEVRETVEGYRRLALSDALAGARMALTAAGIDCDVDASDTSLPNEVDTVLAWAVREGTTNVIRHSDARRCAIRVRTDGADAAVEIEDDGTAVSPDGTGSGLAGLRERARRVHGELETHVRPEGGFRLRLTVPLPEP
jgi:two-component system sensor histidine kinase DesK